MKIDDEIKSRFTNAQQKAHVNILFTANQLEYHTIQILKPFGLSPQQFNILRILRGQNGKAVPLKLLSERMLDRMSNTSRLVDKLVSKKFVKRTVRSDNRRQVDITITSTGLEILEKAYETLEKKKQSYNSMTDQELDVLSDLLDRYRG